MLAQGSLTFAFLAYNLVGLDCVYAASRVMSLAAHTFKLGSPRGHARIRARAACPCARLNPISVGYS